MSEFDTALQEELQQIWDDVRDVSPEELELAKELALDAAHMAAHALLGSYDEIERDVVMSTKDQISATAAKRAVRVARLAIARTVNRVFTAGLGLLAG